MLDTGDGNTKLHLRPIHLQASDGTTAMAHLMLTLGCLTLYAFHDGEDRKKECSDLTLPHFVLSHALNFVIIAILLRYIFVY